MSLVSRLTASALLTIILTAVLGPAVLAADKTGVKEFPLDPSELHRFLSEGKSRAAADRGFAEKFFAQSQRENTQTNYDVKVYDIGLRVDDTTHTLFGRVKFVADATIDGVTAVQVDLLDNMPIDSIVSPAGQLTYARADNVVTVTLDQAYNTGEQFEFVIYYYGQPVGGTSVFNGFAWHVKASGEYSISSVSEPYGARSWWPCKDRNDDKADTFHIAVTVDTRFYAASNGTLDSTVFGLGHVHTYYYTMPYPMAAYLFAIAVSDYAVWYDQWIYNNYADTMPLIHAVDPAWYVYSLDHYNVTPTALTVLSNKYGLYPWHEIKYGHATMEWLSAMEHQSMSWMLGSYPSGWGYSEPVVVHEMSHQWWGDYITCKSWADIWLNEGWASYSEALYYQVRQGWAAYHDYMGYMDYTGGTSIYRVDTTNPSVVFNSIVYDKAAWVVHMLRRVLGDSAFFNGIHDYYNSPYAYGALTTEEFKQVWEQSSGMDLGWFFDEWIYGEYRPNYRYAYWVEPSDSGGYDVFLAVDQIQTTDPQVFQMPVDFSIEHAGGQIDTISLAINNRKNTIALNFPDSIVQIKLDPDNWVLKYATNDMWRLHFVTTPDLPPAQQLLPYEVTLDTRGGTGSNTFSITGGALPNGLSLDSTTGVLSGVPADTGWFTFTANVDDDNSNYWDESDYSLYVETTPQIPGDLDINGELTIADLIYFVDYSFNGGPPPPLPNLADVDGSCGIDIADLVYLVDYMFNDGPAPVMGCVQ